MAIIQEYDKCIIKYRLSKLKNDVSITAFFEEYGCINCGDVRELIGELKELTPKLIFTNYDFRTHAKEVERSGVDKAPALLINTGNDFRIRFYGLPGGYQMESFLEAIEMVGNGKIELQPKTLELLKNIHVPVRIQVFVSQKCPYCPAVVIMAHRLALASPYITAEMVEVLELPDAASHYNIHGVPHVVINESHSFEGVLPEDLYIEEVMKAVGVEV